MPNESSPQHARRLGLLVVLLAAPAVAAAITVCGTELWQARLTAEGFVQPAIARSLASAIEDDDVRGAHALIRAGQDPNALVAVRHSTLTGGQEVQVSPLLWAVATERRASVLMLLGFGARLEKAPDMLAACLADELGNDEIARLLRLYSAALPPESCPSRRSGDVPLLALLADAG